MQMSFVYHLPVVWPRQELESCHKSVPLSWLKSANKNSTPPPPRVLQRILGGGVPPSCPNDNHSSDKNCHFQHPFSDPEEVKKCRIHVYIDRNYVIIT